MATILEVRVIKNFLPIAQHETTTNKKNCWKCCHYCKTLWNRSKTKYIHYTRLHVRINPDAAEWTSRFICDDCLENEVPEGSEVVEKEKIIIRTRF